MDKEARLNFQLHTNNEKLIKDLKTRLSACIDEVNTAYKEVKQLKDKYSYHSKLARTFEKEITRLKGQKIKKDTHNGNSFF